jgi:hypothetical protein
MLGLVYNLRDTITAHYVFEETFFEALASLSKLSQRTRYCLHLRNFMLNLVNLLLVIHLQTGFRCILILFYNSYDKFLKSFYVNSRLFKSYEILEVEVVDFGLSLVH